MLQGAEENISEDSGTCFNVAGNGAKHTFFCFIEIDLTDMTHNKWKSDAIHIRF